MKELHNYLSALGFDCTTPGTNHFAATLITENREIATLYLHKWQTEGKNILMMDIFKPQIALGPVISKQSIPTPKLLRQQLLNSISLKEECPILYQKILETPA